MDKRRKKVLVVTQYFWPEEFRVNELVSRLVLSGFDVDVVTGRPNYPDGDIYRDYENAPNKFRNYCGATIYRVRNSARGKTKVALLRNYISFALLASIFLLKKTRSHHYDAILAVQLSPIFSVLPALIYGRFKSKSDNLVMDLWPDILFA